ncbi:MULTISPECIES: TetR/AcrR family transcriptional regulator [Pseudomonas]|uniref:Transcriptional regulator, TetR family n=1 Tax=Pseudomonas chlororaphis TaxID=587753 RepID=A0AAX3G3D4_9PSED|nr:MULTISPECIES: TetR/AcrR family transcriptional regulator [Pseudomonas]AZC35283.1 Transcriptional regulator, AcrR family [Pseudomonas chlororaphis subsp. piscium]AZC41824.1 Transcriptional regulator, AcrR family [Pseudomonas chlororaphis subsp. piscium]MBP5058015.1 TetR/AcrR family transcriptional regulator [Pseudomonas chlororaphis]MBP5067761.1 TetR/AcrR family transcriptional regulator [Pseudomonas chlororaphis]MBP5085746.1 TetR/AcrR family transcriptional regulator [Pseudomonas chlororaph
MRAKEFEPDEVADSAMQVFWQRGYAATSIQDLVEGTGLSRSSLYNAFESKNGLYQQALRRYHQLTQANVDLLSQSEPAAALVRQLLMRIVEDEMGDPRQRGCLVANATLELAAQDPAVAALVSQNFLRLENALEQLLIRGQQEGTLAPDKKPRALARFIVNTIQGMRVVSKGSPPQERRERLMDVLEIALEAL